MEVESPRQYSRKDLLASCSFMASTQVEPEETEPIRMQELVLSHSPRSLPKQLPTIDEEDVPLEAVDGATSSAGK